MSLGEMPESILRTSSTSKRVGLWLRGTGVPMAGVSLLGLTAKRTRVVVSGLSPEVPETSTPQSPG